MMEGLLVRLLCMLLTCTAAFSGYIQEDVAYIPEDATYMQKDIAYIQEDGSTIVEAAEPKQNPINLKKFTFASISDEGSMEVCTNETLIGDNATLIYISTITNIQHNAEGTIKEKCATFNTPEGFELPEDMINYVLTILNDTTGNRQVGKASFAVNEAAYKEKLITCGGTKYTREMVSTERICTDADGQIVKENKKKISGDIICYTLANKQTDVPDEAGCLDLPEGKKAGTIAVCITEYSSNVTYNDDYSVSVTSLSYDTDSNTKLALTFPKTAGISDTTEIIIQTRDKVEFRVVEGETASVDGFEKGSKVYEVCAVIVDGKDFAVSKTAGSITDINVITYVDPDIEMLEFGFDNQNDDKFYYYATVTDGTKIQNVGIDCSGIVPTSTCYGFIDVAKITTDRVFTVQYSDEGTGPADSPNTIILNIPEAKSTV